MDAKEHMGYRKAVIAYTIFKLPTFVSKLIQIYKLQILVEWFIKNKSMNRSTGIRIYHFMASTFLQSLRVSMTQSQSLEISLMGLEVQTMNPTANSLLQLCLLFVVDFCSQGACTRPTVIARRTPSKNGNKKDAPASTKLKKVRNQCNMMKKNLHKQVRTQEMKLNWKIFINNKT